MIRSARSAFLVAIVAVALAGCGGGGGSNTDCGLNGCTVTFPRAGLGEVSVLGVTAKLVSVDGGSATVAVAGQTVTVPVGGQTDVNGFSVGVERVTDADVVVRVRPGGGAN